MDDPHLVGLENMPFQRPFMAAPTSKGAYLIRGPRQVGKTSLLKSMLKQATDQGRSSFYFSCENLADYKDLAQVLESARGCDLVLIDEISFVREWWRAVKHALDSAHIQVLVITGSNTVDKNGLKKV